jgi:FkbM family methyltransferase
MCRKSFYAFNKALFFLSLKGMGIGNWETPEISGEKSFLQEFGAYFPDPLVLDIGANVGSYSNLVKRFAPGARIYAFEPHPLTFKKLSAAALDHGYHALNAACSDVSGRANLFDHKSELGDTGTQHASLSREVIEVVRSVESASWEVQLITLDEFVKEQGLGRINLLKIDVEGVDLNVVKGAKKTIDQGLVDVIHFEFNQSNVVTRVFMKDFHTVLSDYHFYRMLPDGLASLGAYFSPLFEIFDYQNIVAVRKGLDTWLT